METILKAYNLWETLGSTEGVNERKDNTTKVMIFQTLSGDVLMQVAQFESAKEVCDAIKTRFLGADMVQRARLQTLRRELESLKMNMNETVSNFASKLGSIRSKFKSLGATLKDKKILRKLLISVPKKYLPVVENIEQYSEIVKMPFEEAVGRITAFEEHLKFLEETEHDDQGRFLIASASNLESLIYERGRGDQNRVRGRGSFRGGSGRVRSTSQETEDNSKFRCFYCGEYEHFERDCSKWKDKDEEKEEEAHLAYEDEPALL
ncbi:uncharacterized protein LOC143626554 [Bidens hawaiensis]|uniref:uncharacterized protein LOC143626554 n=1 Tax=Bidens hawaiensis TaxID=980011 RepID=UPI00404963BE